MLVGQDGCVLEMMLEEELGSYVTESDGFLPVLCFDVVPVVRPNLIIGVPFFLPAFCYGYIRIQYECPGGYEHVGYSSTLLVHNLMGLAPRPTL